MLEESKNQFRKRLTGMDASQRVVTKSVNVWAHNNGPDFGEPTLKTELVSVRRLVASILYVPPPPRHSF